MIGCKHQTFSIMLEKHLFASQRETAGATFYSFWIFALTSALTPLRKGEKIFPLFTATCIDLWVAVFKWDTVLKQQLTMIPISKLRTISKY